MADKAAMSVSRRRMLQGIGALGIGSVAGCTSQRAISDARRPDGGSGPSIPPLTADGSSTVYPIADAGAQRWNGNPPASDEEYWGPGNYGIETDENLADYFASMYGFEPTGARSNPPYLVNTALSHSGTGIKALMENRVDMGNSSAPVASELPEADQETLSKFTDHVVGVDGQPIVVSSELYDAGVTQLTAEQLRRIYTKEITNWQEVGGPDRTIRAVGRSEGSGTDTAFRANLYGDPNAEISPDIRKGQNHQVATIVEQADNAIAYLALAFVDPDGPVRPIGLEVEGTVYEYGKNLGATAYPLSRDLHVYTWEGTSRKEAAFIRLLLSPFGQQECVEPNNYFVLPEDRRRAQIEKLPDPA